MKTIFTYGSLMFAPVWQSLVIGHYHASSAQLYGYQRFAVLGEEYPVIKPGASGDVVTGVTYYDIASADMQRLDDFEGSYYQRKTVPVVVSGTSTQEEVYALRPDYYHIASRQAWSAEAFAENGITRFMARYKGFA